MFRRRVMVAGVLAVGLILAACGGGGSSKDSDSTSGGSGSSSGKSGPEITCSSISKETAEQILGGPIDAPSPSSAPSSGCSWYLATNDLSVNGITALNTEVFVFDGTQAARKNPEVQQMFTFEDVQGLGDAAYYQMQATEPKGSLVAPAILLVKQGDRAYNISVTKKGASLAEIKSMERQAAEAILKS